MSLSTRTAQREKVLAPAAATLSPRSEPDLTAAIPRGTIEQLQLGHVICDFLRQEIFQNLCTTWLTNDEQRFHHVITLNPEMVMAAESNIPFRQALQQAKLRVPDGAGLIWAQWFIRSQFWSLIPSLIAFSFRDVERITGVDTVWLLARLCARFDHPLYLLGGTAREVERTATLLRDALPSLQVHTSADHTYNLEGPAEILADIRHRAPAVLLVAYGAVKQTLWIERHKQELPSVRIAVGVGGAFSILSEEKPRAPRILRQFNLEWLWRLLLEPSRLPRIWQATVRFPLLIQRQKAADPPLFASPDTQSTPATPPLDKQDTAAR
ncbi:MAG: WecB/TagA/CpsF family glycosyltransferase [Candidatus Andersenbacteria bacterium]